MNKKKFLASGLILFGLLPMFAFAEDSDDTSTSTRVREEVRNRIEERSENREEQRNTIKANIEARKEEVKNAVQERREAVEQKVLGRLEKFVSTIVTRFESATGRLETLSARIKSRIDKLNEAGIDTTDSQKLLDEANAKILLAKAEVAKIKPKADEVVSGDTRALYPELKEVVNTAKEAIKEAHSALIEVVKSLKPGQQRLEEKLKSETENATEDQNS